jgi:hypothetical protein
VGAGIPPKPKRRRRRTYVGRRVVNNSISSLVTLREQLALFSCLVARREQFALFFNTRAAGYSRSFYTHTQPLCFGGFSRTVGATAESKR